MKNIETKEEYEIEYQNADYYGEYKYSDLLSKLSNESNKKKIILTTCVITFLIFTLCALISYDNSTVQPRTSIKKTKKHTDNPTVSMIAVGDLQ